MIRRVLRATRLSLRLQTRARFPQIYLILTVPTVLVFLFAVPASAVAWALPLFLFAEPGLLGTNMVGAFRYMEKEDGTASALMVTPLRPVEHLIGLALASAIVGTAFGTLTSIAITFDVARGGLVAVALSGFCFLSSLVGFALSMRFSDFSRFILGAVPWVLAWQLPLLAYLGVVPWPAVGWIPSSAGILALSDTMATEPNVPWILALSALMIVACVPATVWVARTHEHRIRTRAEFA